MQAIARAVVALLLAALAFGAAAQSYPTKPVRIINPFAPGGATDRAELAKWAKIVKDSGAKVD